MNSKNITIDHLGLVTIVLGEYFSFPDDFMKLFNDGDSELKSIFKISLAVNEFQKFSYTFEMVSYKPSKMAGVKRGKKIGDRSVQELMGYTNLDNTKGKGKLTDSDFKEFMDSDRYETTIKNTPHILIFKFTFDDPW